MFPLLSIIFLLFTLLYAVFTGSVIYHFRVFVLPSQKFARIIVPIFVIVSALLWLSALYFLMQLRT